MATETYKQANREDQLAGEPQLDVSQPKTLAGSLALLARKIYRHSSPESNDVIQ